MAVTLLVAPVCLLAAMRSFYRQSWPRTALEIMGVAVYLLLTQPLAAVTFLLVLRGMSGISRLVTNPRRAFEHPGT